MFKYCDCSAFVAGKIERLQSIGLGAKKHSEVAIPLPKSHVMLQSRGRWGHKHDGVEIPRLLVSQT